MESITADCPDDVAIKMVEIYITKWLCESEDGECILRAFVNEPFDRIIDHVFELLNLGFLKIIGDPRRGFRSIGLCIPPQPPRAQIQRVRAH
jgi:hypothetical protein